VYKRRWKIGRSRQSVLALTWVVALIAWLGCPAWADEESDVALTQKDNGREVTLGVGSTVTIRLEAILGTGYSWQIASDNSENLLAVGKPEFEPSRSGQPGAMQYQIFRFKAQKVGTSDLMLRYVRPWQKEVPEAKGFRVRVTVR
jgi:predicted secreted protein